MDTVSRTRRRGRTLYDIKPAFVGILEPIRLDLEKRNIQPTHVTLAAIPAALAAMTAVVVGQHVPIVLLLVPVFVVAWMGLNALDGGLARGSGRASATGAVLNELVDRLGDVFLITAGFLVAPVPVAAAVAIGVFGSELVAAIGWAATGERTFEGPMGKPDRAATVAIGALGALVWGGALVAAFTVVAAGSMVGLAIRTRARLRAASLIDGGAR